MEKQCSRSSSEIHGLWQPDHLRIFILQDPDQVKCNNTAGVEILSQNTSSEAVKTSQGLSADLDLGSHSPKAYRRSVVKRMPFELLVRGRSASPNRRGSQEMTDVKEQLKSMVMSRSMPNLYPNRASYNRSIGLSVLSSSKESNQTEGRLVASLQAEELESLLEEVEFRK